MRSLICPISSLRVNENVVRVTALLIVGLTILYVFTANIYIVLLLMVDFFVRSFTNSKFSPLSWLATQTNNMLKLPVILTDKAKKIFSARVGFLFAVAILTSYPVHLPTSEMVSLILVTFALLESVLNLCVGCLVYTYFVFPYFGQKA